MDSLIGSIAIGFLLGWLLWKLVHPEGQTANVTTTLIGVIIGFIFNSRVVGTLTKLEFSFGLYFLGLLAGFFGERVLDWYRTQRRQEEQQAEIIRQHDIQIIKAHWTKIDATIQHRLFRKMRQIPPGQRAVQLFTQELEEWPLTEEGKILAMQEYVRNHVDTGVELKYVTREEEPDQYRRYYYLELARR
jgi:hypothetical protein